MKKNNKRNIILYVVIAVLLIFLIYSFISSAYNVDSTSDFVQKVYSYISSEDAKACGAIDFYSDDKVEINTVSEDVKMCIASRLVNKTSETKKLSKNHNYCLIGDERIRSDSEKKNCSIYFINYEDLSNGYTQVFGDKLRENIEFNLDTVTTCFYNEGRKGYECGTPVTVTTTIDWNPIIYKYINKVTEKDNVLTIEDYFLIVNDGKCYTSNSKIEDTECSEKLAKVKKVTNKFVKSNGKLYKHTFVSEDGKNYYWNNSMHA